MPVPVSSADLPLDLDDLSVRIGLYRSPTEYDQYEIQPNTTEAEKRMDRVFRISDLYPFLLNEGFIVFVKRIGTKKAFVY
jgi:hypothetical protein